MNLKKRIAEIAYKYKLGHLGSYFSSVDIIDSIYTKMQEEDIFILSSGHAALALYVCLEKHKGIDAEKLFLKHGGHPHRDEENYIYCSTGSLGMGLPVALGRSVGKPGRKVYVLISDGECAEGSIWESLTNIDDYNHLGVSNVEVHVNVNGYAAYKRVDAVKLVNKLKAFHQDIQVHYTTVEQYSFLRGLNAHYCTMNEENYREVLNVEK